MSTCKELFVSVIMLITCWRAWQKDVWHSQTDYVTQRFKYFKGTEFPGTSLLSIRVRSSLCFLIGALVNAPGRLFLKYFLADTGKWSFFECRLTWKVRTTAFTGPFFDATEYYRHRKPQIRPVIVLHCWNLIIIQHSESETYCAPSTNRNKMNASLAAEVVKRMYYHRGWGGGGGVTQQSIRGGSDPRSIPWPFYIRVPFWRKGYLFRIPSIEKWYLLNIPTW